MILISILIGWVIYHLINIFTKLIFQILTIQTGTFDIGKILNNDILDFIFKTVFPITRIQNYIESDFVQIQDLDITEQLENRIRYFDLRLALKENDYEN